MCVHRHPVWLCTFTSLSSVQPNVRTCLHLSTKTSMDMYVHVRICAFDLSTNAWVHVNRQHHAITWMCAYMSALASTQVIMCVHWQQPVCLSTFTTKSVLRACLHVRTFLHCLRSLHVRTCQSSTQALCGVDNNLNISCHNSHRLYWHVYTCQHQLQPKSTSFVYKLCLCTLTPKSNHLWRCTYMSAFVP